MTSKSIGAAIVVLAFAMPAAAQDILHYSSDQQGSFNVVSIDPLSLGTPVLNAPYSAEAVTEVTQVHADGNRIERRTSATVARGSDGRVRREQVGLTLPGLLTDGAPTVVTITDPTSGVHLTLNYESKTAFRMRPGVAFGTGRAEGGVEFRTGVLGARVGGIEPGRRPPFEAGRRVPMPPLPPDMPFEEPVMVGSVSAPAMMMASGEVKTERLESRVIEGLAVEGSRTTLTIPAGALGNVLPIEVINERWFSPELQVVVMTRRVDPRFGETVYRLTNVNRDEPATDLFKVPAGFRIEDVKP
jgi:hypothetical protein